MSGGPYGRGKAPERACMKLENWPEIDRRLWLTALAPADPFEERGGERAGYSAISNAKTAKGYGRWLTWLTVSGNLDPVKAPHARITRPRVEAYVQHLRDLGNGGLTILARLQELGEAARVFDPLADWSFINKVASRVRSATTPVRDKRTKLALTDELFALGLSLMEKAADEPTPRLAALSYRDGLVIALLALRPMRRRNLAGLALGATLQQVGGRWLILVPPEETKTGVPIELPWPEVLVPHLETYLAEHRPRLVAMTHRWTSPVGDALWVSSHGSPMTQMALYDQIRQRTREGLGKDVNPHLFRDAAATLLAVADPVHVRLAAPLLGDRTLSTTEPTTSRRKASRRIGSSRWWWGGGRGRREKGDAWPLPQCANMRPSKSSPNRTFNFHSRSASTAGRQIRPVQIHEELRIGVAGRAKARQGGAARRRDPSLPMPQLLKSPGWPGRC